MVSVGYVFFVYMKEKCLIIFWECCMVGKSILSLVYFCLIWLICYFCLFVWEYLLILSKKNNILIVCILYVIEDMLLEVMDYYIMYSILFVERFWCRKVIFIE